jgi:hypothetical protein
MLFRAKSEQIFGAGEPKQKRRAEETMRRFLKK